MYARFIISGMTRDFNDVVKYPGRFNDLTFDETEGVIHKAMIYADTPAVSLEPVDEFLVVKNMSNQNVTLTFNTQMNLWLNPGTTMRSTILPGQIASFGSLDPLVTPTLTATSAAECEVILVGFPEWPDTGPDWFCDMWAVGYDSSNAKILTINHDQFGVWTQVLAHLAIPADSELHDVCGIETPAASDYWWSVGEQGTDPPVDGLFCRWNSPTSQWVESAVADDNSQYGTWGYAPDDWWSVGGYEGNSGEIWFLNGTNWVDTYSPEQEGRCFFHVHGIASDDTWAVGEGGMVYHWDGVSWTEWDSGSFPDAAKNLYGVWQQDANNVWVCGGTTTWDPGGGTGAIYHLDVTSGIWTIQPVAVSTMHCLWGFGGNDIYCGGNDNTMLHYDGAVWTAMVMPTSATFAYRGVFGCYPWAVYACGHEPGLMSARIMRWDTVSWTADWSAAIEEDLLYGIKGVHVKL